MSFFCLCSRRPPAAMPVHSNSHLTAPNTCNDPDLENEMSNYSTQRSNHPRPLRSSAEPSSNAHGNVNNFSANPAGAQYLPFFIPPSLPQTQPTSLRLPPQAQVQVLTHICPCLTLVRMKTLSLCSHVQTCNQTNFRQWLAPCPLLSLSA